MPNSNKKFYKQFLKSRREIGSVTPSSRFLTKAIIKKIDFPRAKTIIELGPGTGVFTEQIIKKMSENCRLLVLELNEEMFKLLQAKITDPRVILVQGSASDILSIAQENNFSDADYIISSLPLTVMPESVTHRILASSQTILSVNGKYIQFMYTGVMKQRLKKYFSNIHQSFVFLNFPPAFIFECKI